MRRINTLLSIPIIVSLVAACTPNNVSPTQEASKPPQDVATAVGSGPDPNATEPSARPSETASANLPTATPEVQIGYGGPLSEQAIKDIEAGKYVSQIEGTIDWANYWYPNGLVGSEVSVGFLEDQNGQLMAGIDGGDYWLFPPVVNGEPVYQGAPAPGTPLAENYDPFRVNKVITEQQALDQGYSPDMAKFLDGSAAELRGGMLTRVKDGKAIAYVGEQSRRWEVLREFTPASSKSEATKVCNISNADVADWIRYTRINDASGRFTDKVIFWPLVESEEVFGPGNGFSVFWGGTEQNANPRTLFGDPETRQTRRAGFCNLEGQHIRLIKFLNPSGTITWYGIRTVSPDDSFTPGDDFPAIQWNLPMFEGFNDPYVQSELREWLKTNGQSDFPAGLENKLLTNLN
jgi:hypothetical protein